MEQKKHYTGLTDEQVLESREKHGNNILSPPEREPLWKLFLEKFKDPIIRILLIAAFLSLAIAIVHHANSGTPEYAETIGIFCAIFLATGVSFWFEMDANRKFDVLNTVNDDTLVKVIRNDNIHEVSKKDIVVGDIVLLETGEEVPADGELLEAISLQIDESSLTGEPLIHKTINPDYFNKDATYPSNWVMRGTTVMDGHGIFEVKSVGDATEYGKVAQKSTEVTGEETPLNQQLNGLAKFIGFAGFVLAGLTFGVLFVKDIFLGSATYSWSQLGLLAAVIAGIFTALIKVWLPLIYDGLELFGRAKKVPDAVAKGSWLKWLLIGVLVFAAIAGSSYIFGVDPLDDDSWISIDTAARVLQYFMVAVTLIVVAVPEGLPMSVTLSLAMSMRRMLKTNNLVRKMHACETMGATTVICTDKTGTLTQNQMQVHDTKFYGLHNQELGDNDISNLIKENISANSTAHLDFTDPHKIKTIGNPTEAALLLWLHNERENYLDIREQTEVIEQLTFSTERKYMATLVKSSLCGGRKVLYVKGAPEIVLGKSDTILDNGSCVATSELKDVIEKQLVDYQNKAMRTLALAYKYIDEDNNKSIKELTESGLTFLGIIAISDPIRKEVPSAVNKCLNAGVDVKIVTGDTPGTAKEIARQIGIWNNSDDNRNIITGVEFEALTDDEARKRIKYLKVMCRARPTDKQRLVQLLQKNGEIVAVTGDGTNDAPALNYAHVGLSMGSGTSVAKEASDITLLDDSFNSISTAIMWGRSLYQNIQRFILFQLTINLTALIIVFLGSIFGYESPLTVTQMLWVNLIMDTFAAGALASLPPDYSVMNKKPRRNTDFIINKSMRHNILYTGISFVILLMALIIVFMNQGALAALFPHIPEAGRVDYSLSYFFTVFVMLQFWNLFNAKAFLTDKSAFTEMNKSMGFIVVALIIIVGQVLIVEFGGEVFRTVPLKWHDWVAITLVTSLVLWVGEISRLIRRNRKKAK